MVKNSIVRDWEAIEQSICVMLVGKVITKNNFNTKKYCIDNEIVLDEVLYILSRHLRIQTGKKIILTLRCTIHEGCGGFDCFLFSQSDFMTWPILKAMLKYWLNLQ